jgi:hypothetical protein
LLKSLKKFSRILWRRARPKVGCRAKGRGREEEGIKEETVFK